MNSPTSHAIWAIGETVDGRYRVIGELGRGGMGIVHRVRHLVWGIDMAVKSSRPDLFSSSDDQELFVREAEAWVSLGLHPNICACHYVRSFDGVPRVFAEYVDGGSLAEWIADGRLYAGDARQALARVLDTAIQAAFGLEHAHRRGLVHQDVKPANVLLDGAGVAKITDFGLARSKTGTYQTRLQTAPEASVLVPTGGMTVPYAPPEQLAGEPVGRRSDVYSFAVSVLEMVTGRVRWSTGSVAGLTLEEYLADPANPVAAPAEIAHLLRRCLRQDPAGRPPSMADVAGVLCDVYEQVTGSTYPRPTPREADLRADEFNNRGLSLLDLSRESEAESAFEQALDADPRNIRALYNDELLRWRRGRRSDEDAVARLEGALRDTGDPSEARLLLAQIQLERGELPAARALLDAVGRERPDEPEAAAARQAADSGAVGHARSLIVRRVPWPARRLDELEYPRSRGFATYESLPVALTHDARLALTGCPDGTLRLWDVPSGRCVKTLRGHRREVEAVDLTPDGRHALSQGADGVVRLWNLSEGFLTRLLSDNPLHRGEPRLKDLSGVERVSPGPHRRSVHLTPDGRTAVAIDVQGTVRVWDTADGRLRRVLPGHTEGAGVQVTADGSRVIATPTVKNPFQVPEDQRDFAAVVWDVDSGRRLHTLGGHRVMPKVLHISPDGRRAVTASFHELRLWDVESGRLLRTFVDANGSHAAALSPDGRLLASAGPTYHGIRLWETDTGRCRRTYRGHEADATAVAFLDGGRTLVSAGADRTVRTWSLPGGYACAPRLSRPRHHAELSGLGSRVDVLLADAARAQDRGRYGVALGHLHEARAIDGYARAPHVMAAWRDLARFTHRVRPRAAWPVREFTPGGGKDGRVALTADGRLAATGSWDDTARLWDVHTGALMKEFTGHAEHVLEVHLSEDGSRLLTADSAGAVRLWHTGSGACLRALRPDIPHPMGNHLPVAACLLPGGDEAVIATENAVHWWNLTADGIVRTVKAPGQHHESVIAAAPDGHTIAVGSSHGVQLLDARNGRLLHTLTDPRVTPGNYEIVERLCFTHGGQRLIVAGGYLLSYADTIREWDVATGTAIRDFGAPHACSDLAATADGDFAISCGTGTQVVAWDVRSGRRLLAFDAHAATSPPIRLAMTPNGQLALARTMDGTLRVWQIDWELAAAEEPEDRPMDATPPTEGATQ
ncbi:protein kinase [Streptomyces sp. NPDC056002]|uniref:protein kinase domain-containing protein n=1 Tax=Streptomyces sp. NPDC056002 TaxID=3345675 RepID=UPI0035D73D56